MHGWATDVRLGWVARGLMASMEAEGPAGSEELMKRAPSLRGEGRDVIRRALASLVEAGYLTKSRYGYAIQAPASEAPVVQALNGQVPVVQAPVVQALNGSQVPGSQRQVPGIQALEEEVFITTTSSVVAPEIQASRMTERVRKAMATVGIAVSDPWQIAWEQALATEQGFGAEDHLVQWLLNSHAKGYKTRPDTWLHWFQKNRDEWLAERAELERPMSLNDEGWERELRQFRALRDHRMLTIAEREAMLAEGKS